MVYPYVSTLSLIHHRHLPSDSASFRIRQVSTSCNGVGMPTSRGNGYCDAANNNNFNNVVSPRPPPPSTPPTHPPTHPPTPFSTFSYPHSHIFHVPVIAFSRFLLSHSFRDVITTGGTAAHSPVLAQRPTLAAAGGTTARILVSGGLHSDPPPSPFSIQPITP